MEASNSNLEDMDPASLKEIHDLEWWADYSNLQRFAIMLFILATAQFLAWLPNCIAVSPMDSR